MLRQDQDGWVASMSDVAAAAAQAFRECVARRRDAGLPAEFWWRDDDLVAGGDEFRRLGLLSRTTGVVPLVAVIPAQADPGLGDLAAEFPQIVFCQHGYAHENHEAPDAPKSEFGAGRGAAAVRADLIAGRQKMEAIFGRRHAAVFVPPWNRFPAEYSAILVEEMFSGFSGYRGEASIESGRGLRCADVDIDVLNWGDPPSVIDPDTIAARLSDILGSAEPGRTGPIGILTHHRVVDAASWGSIEAVFALIASTPGAAWCNPRRLFAVEGAAGL
jgi:hypothetical protein